MRKARSEDWQRRLRAGLQNWPTRLSRLSFSDVPSLGTADIPFLSPLTVISGPNGVGKSTLLRALWGALAPGAAAKTLVANRKLTAGTATVDLHVGGTATTVEVEFFAGGVREVHGATMAVTHIDSAAEVSRHQTEFCRFSSAEEIINGVGSRELNKKSLSDINFILNREYRSVSLYEVEVGDISPYFEVSYGNDRYDTRTMGSGEAAAFYLWWILDRAEKDSILLIEEPETFLSFSCQGSLAQYLISILVEKRITAIITSHSSPLVTAVPKESLRFLSRGQAGLEIFSENPPPIYLRSIGIDPPQISTIFVEDEMGRAFCKGVLERFNASLARRVFVENALGEGEVIGLLRATARFEGPIKHVGLFDGDMRGKIPDDVRSRSAFLPGDQAPEILFRAMISADPQPLGEMTGNGQIRAILAGLEGANHHDWYERISKELGYTKSQLFALMFSIWMRLPDNATAAITTYETLEKMIFEDHAYAPPGAANNSLPGSNPEADLSGNSISHSSTSPPGS